LIGTQSNIGTPSPLFPTAYEDANLSVSRVGGCNYEYLRSYESIPCSTIFGTSNLVSSSGMDSFNAANCFAQVQNAPNATYFGVSGNSCYAGAWGDVNLGPNQGSPRGVETCHIFTKNSLDYDIILTK
jgi:hypothetical protein